MNQGRKLQEIFSDPLGERSDLPLKKTLYPLGLPVEIATNDGAVMEAAAENWNGCQCAFAREPIRVSVIVQGGEGAAVAEPVYRLQCGILMIIADRGNFGVCDLRSRSGWCLVSREMLLDRDSFRWYFLEAMVYILLAQEDTVPVHAACVAHEEHGVLLCGASGAGKSTLAFACARAGWTYIGDDATMLLQKSRTRVAMGKPHRFHFRPEAVNLFPELNGYPKRIRANGKPTVEIPTSAFPEIATASQCRVECIVFLDRNKASGAVARALPQQEAFERLMHEMPNYGDEVCRRYQETMLNLGTVPI
jgi:hypothetical protein